MTWDVFPATVCPALLIPSSRHVTVPQDHALQSNGTDCGVWVLACIAAIVRGFDSVLGSDSELSRYRKWLCAHALRLDTVRTEPFRKAMSYGTDVV